MSEVDAWVPKLVQCVNTSAAFRSILQLYESSSYAAHKGYTVYADGMIAFAQHSLQDADNLYVAPRWVWLS